MRRVGMHAIIDSAFSFGLAIVPASRFRQFRTRMFITFREAKGLTQVKLAGIEATTTLFRPLSVHRKYSKLVVYLIYLLLINTSEHRSTYPSSYADNYIETVPDNGPILMPSALGDMDTYIYLGIGSIFLGSETGLLTVTGSASRPSAKVETAFMTLKLTFLETKLML